MALEESLLDTQASQNALLAIIVLCMASPIFSHPPFQISEFMRRQELLTQLVRPCLKRVVMRGSYFSHR